MRSTTFIRVLLLGLLLLSFSGKSQNFNIVPDSIELEVLKEFYTALDGPNWDNNLNWPTIEEWPTDVSVDIAKNWRGIGVKNGDINIINLLRNGLSGNLPPSLTKLIALEELLLGGNEIYGKLPENLGDLNKLTWLNLYSNNLSDSIPASIGLLVI